MYFVAKHYGLRLSEIWNMDEIEFRESFAWAAAAERIKVEEIEKATEGAKSGSPVGKTDATAQPFPYSDNRW
jgi:hypothetical protein